MNRSDYLEGPILASRVISLKFHVEWRDQGFGGRKGAFVTQLMRGDELICESSSYEPLGICERSVDYQLTALDKSLQHDHPLVGEALPGDHYRILKILGGGGGHQLDVKNFKILVESSEDQIPAKMQALYDVFGTEASAPCQGSAPGPAIDPNPVYHSS